MLNLSVAYKAVKTVSQVLPHLLDWSIDGLPSISRTRFFVLSENNCTLLFDFLQVPRDV
jgi:hypothetical protein